jgi:hypothetical protein
MPEIEAGVPSSSKVKEAGVPLPARPLAQEGDLAEAIKRWDAWRRINVPDTSTIFSEP